MDNNLALLIFIGIIIAIGLLGVGLWLTLRPNNDREENVNVQVPPAQIQSPSGQPGQVQYVLVQPKKKPSWIWYVLVTLIIMGCLCIWMNFPTITNIGSTVTMAEYDQIQIGMSYQQVVNIIGEEGEEMSRVELIGITTVMYGWTNNDGSNMNAMFQNGGLISKAQFGLD